MDLIKLLRSVEMFAGLTEDQLTKLSTIFEHGIYQNGQVLFSQGEQSDHLFLVREGFVEVVVESPENPQGRTLVHLGPGQSVGEMALIDQGARSATVRAASEQTIVAAVSRAAFESLCDSDAAIGYRVMRNIAADLSFRIRRQNV